MSTDHPITRLAGYGADAVYDMFGVLSAAPSLPSAAADSFLTSGTLGPLQGDLLKDMVDAGVIRVEAQWTARIEECVGLYRNRQNAESKLPDVERQLKTTAVQLKHSADQRDRGRILKSKTTQWEETNKHEKLEKQHRDLTEEKQRYQAVIDSADEVLSGLVSAISAAPDLSKARWLSGQVVRVTNDGAFLASCLKGMNKEHFRGRLLCDILVIGPLLA